MKCHGVGITLIDGQAKDKQEKRQDILDRVAVAWFDIHEETGDDADNIRYKEDMLKPIKVKSHPKKNKKNDIDEN